MYTGAFVISVGTILGTATLWFMWLMGIFAAITGICLGALSVLTLARLLISSGVERDAGILPQIYLTFMIFGAITSSLCAVGDKVHFMNRDDSTWAYLSLMIAAIIVGISYLVGLQCMWFGCRCCSSCCCSACACRKGEGCCGNCCFGENDADDVQQELDDPDGDNN